MTFSELKSELFARGTEYLEADESARAGRWINQAYREILNLQAWPFLETSKEGTAGAGFVEITDLRKIRFVTDTSDGTSPGRALRRVSLDTLVSEGYDDASDETGVPSVYYMDGATTVRAFPVGGTIKVYYIKRVAALSADADEPVFDEQYHDLIIDRAMMKAYKDTDNFEAAAALRSEYNAGLAAMAEDYLLTSREVQFISGSFYDG